MERQIIIERTQAGLASARARGRVGGRPTVMTVKKIAATKRLLDAGSSIDEVAESLEVSRASIYRHLIRVRANYNTRQTRELSDIS